MTRPLYLGAAARQVALDGPALRVIVEARADSRVPLRLLSRVVSRTEVDWTPAALSACMAAGIPLVFLRGNGAPLGYCLPALPRTADLARSLDMLEQEPDGMAAFRTWAMAEERRAILVLTGNPPARTGFDLRPARIRKAVLTGLGANYQRSEAMWNHLEGLLAVQIAGHLLAASLPPYRAAPAPAGRLDLHGACLAAARWELVPALRRATAHRAVHPRAWSEAAARAERLARQYEALSPGVAASMRRRLRRLEAWLWETWREETGR